MKNIIYKYKDSLGHIKYPEGEGEIVYINRFEGYHYISASPNKKLKNTIFKKVEENDVPSELKMSKNIPETRKVQLGLLTDSMIEKALINTKIKKCNELYSNFVNNFITRFNFNFNGKDYYFEIHGIKNAQQGINEAITKIQEDTTMQPIVDSLLPPEYQGMEKMYTIYVAPFSKWKINHIIFKQSKKNEIIQMFQDWEVAINKKYTEKSDYSYYRYYLENLDIHQQTIWGLSSIKDVDNYKYSFNTLQLSAPNGLIENVTFNY